MSKQHKRVAGEYIENGNFATGDLAPWHEPGAGGKVRIEREGDRHYAAFSADGKLVQNDLPLTDRPESVTFSLDIRVEDGDEELSHDVQVVLFFQTGSEEPFVITVGVREYPEWTTVSFPLTLSRRPNRADVELLVQRDFTKKVSMTNISLSNNTIIKKANTSSFEIDVYESGRKHK